MQCVLFHDGLVSTHSIAVEYILVNLYLNDLKLKPRLFASKRAGA